MVEPRGPVRLKDVKATLEILGHETNHSLNYDH